MWFVKIVAWRKGLQNVHRGDFIPWLKVTDMQCGDCNVTELLQNVHQGDFTPRLMETDMKANEEAYEA